MADLKPQVYKDPRPAEYFTRFHERGRTRQPTWMYSIVRIILTPFTLVFYRCRAIGIEHVPHSGPVILAPNHFSQMDHFFAAVFLRRRVRFMAKSQLFANRFIEWVFYYGGVFPVRRGFHDEEAFLTARAILDRGGCVLMYPEGGRSRSGGLGEPKPGVGRIALENGVPVIPMAIHGSLAVRGWRRGRFPKVTVQYGEPMTFPAIEQSSREQQMEVAEAIFGRVKAMYDALEAGGRRGALKARPTRSASRAPRSVPRRGRG
jgi:1-acyl-sn-glycerol-3-phosphate acyltransferase